MPEFSCRSEDKSYSYFMNLLSTIDKIVLKIKTDQNNPNGQDYFLVRQIQLTVVSNDYPLYIMILGYTHNIIRKMGAVMLAICINRRLRVSITPRGLLPKRS